MKTREYYVMALGVDGRRAFVNGVKGQNYHEAYNRALQACRENVWVLRCVIYSDETAMVVGREHLLKYPL